MLNTPGHLPNQRDSRASTVDTDEPKDIIASAIAEAMNSAVPKAAVGPKEVAKMLGVSRSYFDVHILPRLKIRRAGGRILIPVREIDRFLLS
ncbi:MAG: helix-turn-helix domain-containing protein [Actinobacteria bacterium]|nr:helix-turn-helix domain-containing protein [Actinomycetota bacterium]